MSSIGNLKIEIECPSEEVYRLTKLWAEFVTIGCEEFAKDDAEDDFLRAIPDEASGLTDCLLKELERPGHKLGIVGRLNLKDRLLDATALLYASGPHDKNSRNLWAFQTANMIEQIFRGHVG